MESKVVAIQQIVGRNIRYARLAQGYSLAQFAARVEIDRGDLCNIENGHVNIRLTTLYAIVTALKVPFNQIFVI